MTQTAYQASPDVAIEGQILSTDHETVTRFASAVVKPGKYVVFDGDQCAHPTLAPTKFNRGGVAVRNPYKQNDGDYAIGDPVTILVRGEIGVDPEVAVTKDTQAYVRHTPATTEQRGAFLATSGGETDAVLGLTETDANVEDGTFVVHLLDSDGIEYTASFTSSTTSHANAATGIAADIALKGPFTATPGAEVADKIDITISHTTANKWVRITHVESVGASALSIETQGGSLYAEPVPGLIFRQTASTGVVKLDVRPSSVAV